MGDLSPRADLAPAPAPPSPSRPGPAAGDLVGSTLVYGLGSVAHRVVTFVLLPVLTRFLRPEEIGASALLDVMAACTVALFSLGVGSSLTVVYGDTKAGAGKDAAVASALGLLGTSVLGLLALGLAGAPLVSVALFGSGERADLVLLALGTAAAMILQVPLQMRLQLEGRAARSVGLSVATTVLLVGGSLVGVVLLGRGLRGLWEARLAANLLALALLALPLGLGRPFPFRWATAKDLVRFGLPMVPSFAAVFVLLQGNRYVLSWFRDLESVGVYAVGVQLGMALGLAVTPFSTAWTPYFLTFRDRPAEAARAFSRVATYYVLGIGSLALLCYAGARAALLALTVPPFDAGFRVVGHAATAQLLLGAFNLLVPPCVFAREIGRSGAVQVLAALASIGLNVLLIPAFGLDGAGLALACGTACMVALLWAWNRSRGPRYLQVRYDARRLSIFAAFYVALAALLVRERSLGLAGEVALSAGVAALVVLVAWLLLGRDDRASLVAAVARALGRRQAVTHDA